MDKTCAADIDSTGEKCHSDRFVVGNSLEGADEVSPFEVLHVASRVSRLTDMLERQEVPLIHGSTDLEVHQEDQTPQMGSRSHP